MEVESKNTQEVGSKNGREVGSKNGLLRQESRNPTTGKLRIQQV